ncbi:hypothetical protein NPIL_260621, partial [Nephila pilipes]
IVALLLVRSFVHCDAISATVRGVHKHVFVIHSDGRNKQEYPGPDISPFSHASTEWPHAGGRDNIKWPQNMKWTDNGPKPGENNMKRPISELDFTKWVNMGHGGLQWPGIENKAGSVAKPDNTSNTSMVYFSHKRRDKNKRPPSEGAEVTSADSTESAVMEHDENIGDENNNGKIIKNEEKDGEGKFSYRSTQTENMMSKDFVYICPEGMRKYLSHMLGMRPDTKPSVDRSSYPIDSSESQNEPIKGTWIQRSRGTKKNTRNVQSRRKNRPDKKSRTTQLRSLSILRRNNS